MTDTIDTRYLETLLGYNTRRATLTIIGRFIERMVEFDLRPVDFSVLSLIGHNPGITARQLCHTLNILPPNMVGFLKAFEKRDLIDRSPHPTDGRSMGLTLTKKRPTTHAKSRSCGHRIGCKCCLPVERIRAKNPHALATEDLQECGLINPS